MPARNFIQSRGGRVTFIVALSLLLVFCSSAFIPAYCQDIAGELEQNYNQTFGYSSGSTKAAQLLIDIRSALVRFLEIVLFFAALASIVLASYNMLTGEPSGAKRFFLWGIGLAVGFSVLAVVSSVGAPAVAGGGFAGLQGTVAEVLEILLTIVCMITLVVVIVHIMNGERDGIQKFLRWLIISGVGLVLMEVVRTRI